MKRKGAVASAKSDDDPESTQAIHPDLTIELPATFLKKGLQGYKPTFTYGDCHRLYLVP